MTDIAFSEVEPYARHIPDPPPEPTHKNPASVEQGAGFVELGFIVDGVHVPLVRRKAGGILADIERHRKASTPTVERRY